MNLAHDTMVASESVLALCGFGDILFRIKPAWICVDMVGGDASGLELEYVIDRDVRDLLPADLVDPATQALAHVHRTGTPQVLECRIHTDGQPRWYEVRIARTEGGHILAIARDVHERRHAEHELRDSEAQFRLMADHAPVMLWKSGRDGLCDFFNSRWLEFTGRPMERELGSGWAESIYFEDLEPCMSTYLEAFVERRSFRMEYRMRRADGTFRWILDHGVPRSEGGEFQGFIGSCIDITDIKEATENVRRMAEELELRLCERDVLLREIHHRVKNNLQLITTIFNLQARMLDPTARKLIEEAQNRVRSIALVHEKLCDATSLARIHFDAYVRDLARITVQVGGTASISLELDCAPIELGLDQAVPCGLVIHELVANSLKHGFPDGRRGTISVTVRSNGLDRVSVRVHDDGVGLPEGFDPRKTKTLGFDLITTLVRQLDAKLVIDSDRGTSIDVSFGIMR